MLYDPELISKYAVVVLRFTGWLSMSFGVRGPGCCILRHLSAMPAVKSSRVAEGEIKLRLSEVSIYPRYSGGRKKRKFINSYGNGYPKANIATTSQRCAKIKMKTHKK